MASHSYPTLGFSILQELGSNDVIKKNRAHLVNPGGRGQEIIIPERSFNLKLEHSEPWNRICSLRKSNHFVELDSKPRLLDVHETGQEELNVFLLSREDEVKERGFAMSLLSDLDQEPVKPLLDLTMHHLESSINPDAQILFSRSRAELNDMVSIAAEFHMSKKSARWRKLSRLVPQFQRFDSEVLIDSVQPDAVNLDAVTLAPQNSYTQNHLLAFVSFLIFLCLEERFFRFSNSPEKTKVNKPTPKKQDPKVRDNRESDLYKRNHLHAWESLFSLMIGSEQHRQTTMLSLKKSNGDLLELLTQLSIGTAGTGLAVFFSVACSVASRRVPFCENKVFDTALSFSLVLLSWSVSRLRKAIVDVSRKAIKDEETTNSVERRIKDVYFGAATVIVMVALRFG